MSDLIIQLWPNYYCRQNSALVEYQMLHIWICYLAAGVTTFGKTTGRQHVTLSDIAEDRQQWIELVATSMVEI